MEGFRLSRRGLWSLSVGDSVEAFDLILGMPIHAEPTWPEDGTITARYRCGKQGGLCVVRIDREKRRVTKLAVYRVNVWSINMPPTPYLSEEERKTPGAWFDLYGTEKR